ncbi:nitroreductase [bacterium]|nr:nitroreductase [bacterium]
MYDLEETIRDRRSVRGFHPDRQVPRDVLIDAIKLAQHSPSNCNVQPWEVFIASGAARDRLRNDLVQAVESGMPPSASSPMDTFINEHRKRQIACAAEMYGKMGIDRGDGAGRMRAHLRNFELFDAPHVAIVCMRKEFGVGVALDVGMWVQTFLLALWSRGIGSCAQATLRFYPDIVAKVLSIPDELQILCGISFGYEDPDVPANQARQTRIPIESNVHFVDG